MDCGNSDSGCFFNLHEYMNPAFLMSLFHFQIDKCKLIVISDLLAKKCKFRRMKKLLSFE